MAGGYHTARPLRGPRPNGLFASLTSRGGLPHFSRLTSRKGTARRATTAFKDSGSIQTSSFRAQSRNPCFPALQHRCCDYAQHDGMCRAPLPPSPTPFPVFPHSYDLTSSLLTPHSSPLLTLTPHSSLLTPHSSLLTPSLLTPHSSPLPPHSSLLTPHSYGLTQASQYVPLIPLFTGSNGSGFPGHHYSGACVLQQQNQLREFSGIAGAMLTGLSGTHYWQPIKQLA